MLMTVTKMKMMMEIEMEVGNDESYPAMKFIWWRKLSSDESCLVMKVIIVERSDDLWRFAWGDVYLVIMICMMIMMTKIFYDGMKSVVIAM